MALRIGDERSKRSFGGIKAGAIPTRSRSLVYTYNRHGQREIHETGPSLQKAAETEGPGERTEGPV